MYFGFYLLFTLFFYIDFFWLGENLLNIEKGAQGIYALNLLSLCQGISSDTDSELLCDNV